KTKVELGLQKAVEARAEYEKKLKVKAIDLKAGKLISVLDDETANDLGIKALERLEIFNPKNKKKTIAIVDVSSEMVGRQEVGLFKDVLDALNARDGMEVSVRMVPRPKSIDFIKKKLNGLELSQQEIMDIVQGINDNLLDDIEISAFISGVYMHGFSFNETVAMTKAILSVGRQLKLDHKRIICDKHSIGGVNGRASMLVVPIIAANGLLMPKTSSRAIMSPAGTADAMEVLAPVNLRLKDIKRITEKVGAVISWDGAVDLAPVDDKIIKIEYPLNIDPQGQVIASVMSKKASVNAKFLVIDLPLGPEMKVKSEEEARDMALKFIEVGKALGMKVVAVVTDGSQPSGKAFGPALEAKHALQLLEGKFFDNLAEKSCLLSGALLEETGKAKKGKGYDLARQTLESGKALKKMIEIIKAQGGKTFKSEDVKLGKFVEHIKAAKNGTISYFNIKLLRETAKLAGCPGDKKAGLLLAVPKGQRVRKDDLILTIFAENQEKAKLAKKFASENQAFEMEKVVLEKFE
ncbi:AMP phosphorylase, partial [archaeon]|nr:AMP phosphorylase [archaeon]